MASRHSPEALNLRSLLEALQTPMGGRRRLKAALMVNWTVDRDLQLDYRCGADAAQPELVVQHLVDSGLTKRRDGLSHYR
jgi:hypothetical protein